MGITAPLSWSSFASLRCPGRGLSFWIERRSVFGQIVTDGEAVLGARGGLSRPANATRAGSNAQNRTSFVFSAPLNLAARQRRGTYLLVGCRGGWVSGLASVGSGCCGVLTTSCEICLCPPWTSGLPFIQACWGVIRVGREREGWVAHPWFSCQAGCILHESDSTECPLTRAASQSPAAARRGRWSWNSKDAGLLIDLNHPRAQSSEIELMSNKLLSAVVCNGHGEGRRREVATKRGRSQHKSKQLLSTPRVSVPFGEVCFAG